MASSKEYLAYILEQLSDLEDIRYRAMMGNIFCITGKRLSAAFMMIDS